MGGFHTTHALSLLRPMHIENNQISSRGLYVSSLTCIPLMSSISRSGDCCADNQRNRRTEPLLYYKLKW